MKFLKLLLLIFLVSSCSSRHPIEEKAHEELAKDIERSTAERDKSLAALNKETKGLPPEKGHETPEILEPNPVFIEIVWKVPADSVNRYHIYYGKSRNSPDKHVVVPVSDLEVANIPPHGQVYRYKLKGARQTTSTFVTLQAENEFGLSPKTQVFEIAPTKLAR